jgi:hypothetical protein
LYSPLNGNEKLTRGSLFLLFLGVIPLNLGSNRKVVRKYIMELILNIYYGKNIGLKYIVAIGF